MASSEPFDELYSEDEENGEEWQEQEALGEGGMGSGGWKKDHQISLKQLSELLSVREFKARCKEASDSGLFACPHEDGEMARAMGVTIPELKKLQDECKPAKLLPSDSVDSLLRMDMSNLIKDSPFKSVKAPKTVKEILTRTPTLYGYEVKKTVSYSQHRDPVPVGEVFLSITVFHPFTKTRDQEFVVLGSQKLPEFRDKISCPNDFFVARDFSDDPSVYDEYKKSLPTPPNHSPSAFFFINNTFYNDMRHPNSVDTSRSIIEWANVKERLEHSHRLEQYYSSDMATTTFDQLSLRLGYPYLYTHHATCEHLIMFTDIRLYDPDVDSSSLSDYPKVVHRHRRKRFQCSMCTFSDPAWATVNDESVASSPCYFCEECFSKFHYSLDGKKLFSFEAYPFHPDEC